ncbi:AfsR/SARP family transcriptional regulator [Saccharothrix deserti]|uniref:AfsR/SARP family transcriptional regulator n=1 Tax=Saccharothrix deserti TaxID=2593674 RepID=UPI003083FC11
MEFLLLGRVEVRVDGAVVDVGPARQRCVLVALSADVGQVVSGDQLVDRVWGDRVPHRARGTLRSYLFRLRQALAVGGVGIVRRSGGYVLDADPFSVDLNRFGDLLAQARTATDDRALALTDEALRLWRGEAFAGLDTPWVNDLRDDLEARRVATELDHTDLRLRLGRHAGLVAELTSRVATRPLDERLAGQLMLALYREGRQADALACYQRIRRQLVEEIGAEPGQALREVHRGIVCCDPKLDVASTPVPRQLPAPPGVFTGRTRELAELDAAVGRGTAVISAVGGIGGVGKTWLALHWAHRNVERFPDGQLYVNLRGFDPSGTPTPATMAVRGFLDALGVDSASIPVDPDAQAALYRSVIAGKRALVVLDNARDTEQVVPLLPGTATCAVIVTSRHRLGALVATHGALPVNLDVLDATESRHLLTAHLGAERIAAEPDEVAELLDLCAGLPLAIGIVAARAALSGLPLRALAEELHDTSTRLDALDAGELTANLRAVFSWSYRALDPDTADMFAVLGLVPGPDIGLPAAAALAGVPPARAQVLLNHLERASLIQRHAPGRYRMHELVRLHAAEEACRRAADVRDAASLRLVEFYIHTAYAGDRLLAPHRTPITLPPPGCPPQNLADAAAAMAWFDAEHANLLAVQRAAAEQGRHGHVWRLAWALSTFHRLQGHARDAFEVWSAAVRAADQLGDVGVRSLAYRFLGVACVRLGRHEEAASRLDWSLALAEKPLDQAHTHRFLSLAWEKREDYRRAIEHADQAVLLFRDLGESVWEADMLNSVGWCAALLGDYERAYAPCLASLSLCRRHQDTEGEAAALDSLGYIAHRTGRHSSAVDYFRSAAAVFRDLGYSAGEAEVLDRLGQVYADDGQDGHARDTWRRALELYQSQHRVTEAERVRARLAPLDG